MAVFNHLRKEIDAKIVYYGPGISGKTTNLQFIHQNLKPEQRGKMVSLATEEERTLFFDFLPIELESVRGFKTRFHLYTVPGQIYYGATRRAVLSGADGIIFVADSQADRMEDNLMSLKDLEENLRYYGKSIETIPLVMQYNKRDLPHISTIEELNQRINRWPVPYFESVAIAGKGVFETLTMACRLVLKAIEEGIESRKAPRRPEIIPEKVPALVGVRGGPEISPAALSTEPKLPRVPSTESSQFLKEMIPGQRPAEKETFLAPERKVPLESTFIGKKEEIKTAPEVDLPKMVPERVISSKSEEGKKGGERTFWGRMIDKIWPEAEGKGEIKNLRLLSSGPPQVINPATLKIPLALEIGETGKTLSFSLTINLEKIEQTLD